MIRAYGRVVLAGLTVIAVVSCSNELAPGSGSRADSTAISAPGLRLTTGPTGGHVDFCYGFDPNCSALAHPADGSPFWFEAHPGPNVQLDPITFVFPNGVTNLLVRLQGGLPCTGSHGIVTAFDASGASLGDFALQIDDPSDCGDDDLTGRASVFIATPHPVTKVTITAPSPMSYLMPEAFRRSLGFPPGTLIYGGELRPNFSFDWSASPAVALKVALARETILPLLVRRSFDAGSQTHFLVSNHHVVADSRPDTVTVTVHVTQGSTGPAVAGEQIRLTAVPVDSSGGHIHTRTVGRPSGSFFLPGEDTQVSGFGPHHGEVVLTSSSTGDAKVVYRSSGLGGRERIIVALAVSDGKTAPDTATLTLRVPGLIEMDSSKVDRYVFKPQDETQATQRHGNHNRWVQAAFRDSLLLIFDDYFDNGGQVTDPNSDNRFLITDAGLEYGGLYDVGETSEWSSPHMTHRLGIDMDIRSRTIDVDSHQILQEACLGTKKVPRKRVKRCTFEATGPAHLHIEGFAP